DWVSYVYNKYLKINSSSLRCLSLGCGIGNLERHLLSLGFFRSFDAIDISKGALRQAKKNASEVGIKVNYKIGDLNSIRLPSNEYDVMFANMSLHHVKNLESLFNKIEKCLVKDGLFIINEYIGPDQFQYTKKQIVIINEIIEKLPKIYRKRITDKLILKPYFMPPSVQYMNDNDPSEAIRSSDILKYSYKYFEVLEKHDYGGTISHMLLQDIAGNFNANNSKDRFALEMIIYIEGILIKEKVISSDFSFLVLRKKNIKTSWFKKIIAS
ncbi:class I SAM-dependent methyltransferase, partial [Patescibacteria group bacterium]|nr:class I SAM-dependent methyltransferase [Patescibacteria group bacterium]